MQQLPKDFSFKRMNTATEQKPFTCGVESIDKHFNQNARIYQDHLLSVNYILESAEETVAFYAVSNDLLKVDLGEDRELKSELKKKTSNSITYDILGWPTFPAVKLDFFAVNTAYQEKGLGKRLLEYIIGNFRKNNKTGCLFVTADALNTEKSIKFYKRNKFRFLTDKDAGADSRIMYRSLL